MKRFLVLATALAMTVAASGAAHAEDDGVVKIGHFNWAATIFTAHVYRIIIEEKMGHEVELTKGAPGMIFGALGSGKIDFSNAWLPDTQAAYYEKMAKKTVTLGPVTSGNRLGWVVPDYVPKEALNSIEDLKSEEVREKLDGRIHGIGAGAGITKLSRKALKDYGLKEDGYKLVISSSTGMTAALKRAIENEEWIVVTGWSPHWKFSRWDLRYLEDPKVTLGKVERSEILARKGFFREFPDVYNMLSRLYIPLADVQEGMDVGERKSFEEAAERFVEENEELVEYWITGEYR